MWAALLPLAFRSRPSGSELPSYLFSLSVGGVVIRWLLMLNKNTTENVCFGLLLVAVVGFIVAYCCLCDGLLVFLLWFQRSCWLAVCPGYLNTPLIRGCVLCILCDKKSKIKSALTRKGSKNSLTSGIRCESMGLRRKGEMVKREINNLLLAPAGKGKGKDL